MELSIFKTEMAGKRTGKTSAVRKETKCHHTLHQSLRYLPQEEMERENKLRKVRRKDLGYSNITWPVNLPKSPSAKREELKRRLALPQPVPYAT